MAVTIDPVYSAGTVTFGNGSTTVTGSGTAWLINAKPGDIITHGGYSGMIAAIADDDTLTLVEGWAGPTEAGVTYAISHTGSGWHSTATTNLSLQALLSLIGSGQLMLPRDHYSDDLADRDQYDNVPPPFFWAHVQEDGLVEIYFKLSATAADWSDPVTLEGATGATGATGPGGATGPTGAAGTKWTFATSTTMGDPGTGIMRLNNATLASVSAIAVDDLSADTGNPSVAAFFNTWAASTSTIKGYLILKKVGAQQNFAIFAITGLTDNSGWSQIAVTHVASAGSFSAADIIGVEFVRSGDQGSTGVGDKFDLPIVIQGRPRDGEVWPRYVFGASGTVAFASGLSNSRASAGAASTGTAVFSLKKNGTEFGTVTFTASATGVLASASGASFAAGDVFTMESPSPRDATLSDVSITLAGTR